MYSSLTSTKKCSGDYLLSRTNYGCNTIRNTISLPEGSNNITNTENMHIYSYGLVFGGSGADFGRSNMNDMYLLDLQEQNAENCGNAKYWSRKCKASDKNQIFSNDSMSILLKKVSNEPEKDGTSIYKQNSSIGEPSSFCEWTKVSVISYDTYYFYYFRDKILLYYTT